MTLLKKLRYNLHWIVIAATAGISLSEITSTRLGIITTIAIIWFVMPLVEGNERLKDEVTV